LLSAPAPEQASEFWEYYPIDHLRQSPGRDQTNIKQTTVEQQIKLASNTAI
jgi:hypothetical protein